MNNILIKFPLTTIYFHNFHSLLFCFTYPGSFARVELAKHAMVGKPVAIKVVDIKEVKDSYARKNMTREGSILSKLDHPNIVRLLEIVSSAHFYCLVLQYIPGAKTLSTLLAEKGPFTEMLASSTCRQLVSALLYIHSANILHRDLKPENILLSHCLRKVLLIDFGLSNFWQPGQLMNTHCGSPEFAAPELFRQDSTYGTGIDVWSFGVVLFAMVLRCLPFEMETDNIQTLIKKVFRGLTDKHQMCMSNLSQECVILITSCLDTNCHTRITFPEVAVHPWITRKGRHPVEVQPTDNATIFHKAVQVFCQKVNLQVPPNTSPSSYILNYITKRPFSTTAGCFNVIMETIKAEIQDEIAKDEQGHTAETGPSAFSTKRRFGTLNKLRFETDTKDLASPKKTVTSKVKPQQRTVLGALGNLPLKSRDQTKKLKVKQRP